MKRVVIIGGTTGIGREMAEQYIQKGYAVGISGRTQAALESFRTMFPGTKTAVACFDVQDTNRREYLAQMIESLGGMDVFVYCAGGGTPTDDLNEEIELTTYHTNATGFIDLTMYAFNYFASSKQAGHIVGISSVAAVRGLHAAPAYNATKAFMSNYLEGLWFKAKKMQLPIEVTDIKPGFVATKMAQGNVFWVVTVQKAARLIIAAIERKKKTAFISRRWQLIAWILAIMPSGIIRRTI